MLSLNCKHVQHVKIYLPCNFEVNLITHFGVIAPFSSNCSKFQYFHLISQALLEIDVKFKLQKCSACQDLQKKFPQLKMSDNCVKSYSSWNAFFFVDFHCFWLLKYSKGSNSITKCEVAKAKFWESLTYVFYSNFDNLH